MVRKRKKSKRSQDSQKKSRSITERDAELEEELKALRSEFSRLKKEVQLTTDLNNILCTKKTDMMTKLYNLQKQTKDQSKKSLSILLNLICNYKDEITDSIKKILIEMSILTANEKQLLNHPERIRVKIPELMSRISESKTVKKNFFEKVAQILNVHHSSRNSSGKQNDNSSKLLNSSESESKQESEANKQVQSDNSKNQKNSLIDEQYNNMPRSLNGKQGQDGEENISSESTGSFKTFFKNRDYNSLYRMRKNI